MARALTLDTAGQAHLHDLIGPAPRRGRNRIATVQRVRPGLHQFLEALDGQPALILGRRTDVLASNRMAGALFADFERMPPAERNYARWMFLSDEARSLFVDWEVHARAAVESLRLDVGSNLQDRGVEALVAELVERSREFRLWWAEHRVHQRTHGSKRLRHPAVGELTVDFETLALPGDPDQTMFVYTSQAGTSSRQAMDLLASWVLTNRVQEPGDRLSAREGVTSGGSSGRTRVAGPHDINRDAN